MNDLHLEEGRQIAGNKGNSGAATSTCTKQLPGRVQIPPIAMSEATTCNSDIGRITNLPAVPGDMGRDQG